MSDIRERQTPGGDKVSPSTRWEHPRQIVESDELDLNQKIELLERWQFDEERLAESESEGMEGGERAHLREVSRALDELKARVAQSE